MLRNSFTDQLVAEAGPQWRDAMRVFAEVEDPGTHPVLQQFVGRSNEELKELMNKRLTELTLPQQFCAVRLGFAFSGRNGAEALRTEFFEQIAAGGQLLQFYGAMLSLPGKAPVEPE